MEPMEGKTSGPLTPESVSTKLQRIAELAREAPTRAFRSLAHYIDVEFLKEAYRRTRKDGAVGVDGCTAEKYAENLEGNLQALLDRFKSGSYHAPPVRRVHIPKGTGSETRPIGIPTFEDKILQRAVAMVLAAVYEQDFEDFSWGFRPGRSAHQALDRLWKGLMPMAGGWVLEADIQGFYDSLDHAHLRSFLDRRVCDGVLRRTIDKWLKAGVLEEGRVARSDIGTPQGGVISPLLANVYLHHVLDQWFRTEVEPRLLGRGFLVRYADDFVIVFSAEADARRVLDMLSKRFEAYGLRLHPTKTRLVYFKPPPAGAQGGPGKSPPSGTFDLLGFTHFWARSRKGVWVVKRRTAKGRFTRALGRVAAWCRGHLHLPLVEQQEHLAAMLRGHCGYYGITGNSQRLTSFRRMMLRIWRRWLGCRSQRAGLDWVQFNRLLLRYPLPPALAVHSLCPSTAK